MTNFTTAGDARPRRSIAGNSAVTGGSSGPLVRSPPMRFGILGPLEVSTERGPVVLGGGNQRALLALLLLNAGQEVSRDRLIDELWGEDAPPTAAKIVQNYVSHLRRELGEGDPAGGAARDDRSRLRARAGGRRARCGALRGPARAGPGRAGERRCGSGERAAARGPGALARTAACGFHRPRVRPGGDPPSRRAPAGGARVPHRGRSRSWTPRRGHDGAAGARGVESAARTPARAADARVVSLRTSGRGAGGVPGHAPGARRGGRDRTRRPAQATPGGDSRPRALPSARPGCPAGRFPVASVPDQAQMAAGRRACRARGRRWSDRATCHRNRG